MGYDRERREKREEKKEDIKRKDVGQKKRKGKR